MIKENFMLKKLAIICVMIVILATTFCVGSANLAQASNDLELTSKSACLVDFASGDVLFEKDSNKHLPVASMVKMMTILLTLEEIEKGNLAEATMITTSENASGMGGSQVFIDPYVEYSVGELLKGVIIASANDASVALAEHISGSEKTFVSKMNERAEQLGMSDTHYTNCTGLPSAEQYSCAKDCATILKEVTKYDLYHKYSTIWTDEFVHPSGRKTEIVNTNRLVRYYQGCDSGKTGSTNEAGCCLSASAVRDDMRLISVVVGAPNSQTRFNECSKLFNFGFANFETKNIVDFDKSLCEINVVKGKTDKISVYPLESFSRTVRKAQTSEFDVQVDCRQQIKAPVLKGEEVGKVSICKDGIVIKEIPLIVKEDIAGLSFKDCFDKVVTAW